MVPIKSAAEEILIDYHTTGFHTQTQTLKLHTIYILTCKSTVEEVSFECLQYRLKS